MSLDSHLAELQRKHREIEQKIEEQLRYPGYDDLEVGALKRQKLAIKDKIEKFRSKRIPDGVLAVA